MSCSEIDDSKYITTKFFEGDVLAKLKMWIAQSEFIDGIYSFSNCCMDDSEESKNIKRKTKRNEELNIDAQSFFYLNDPEPFNDEWVDFCHPKRNGSVMVTKTEQGGYYRAHFDSPANGHYSTTIFLNDPSEYEGGELGLWIDGEEKKFKLPAGHGIVYETGIPHHVNTVTKGERLVVVFWTCSTLSVREDLYRWRYYQKKINELKAQGVDTSGNFVGTLKEFVNTECHQLRMKKEEIERKYVG